MPLAVPFNEAGCTVSLSCRGHEDYENSDTGRHTSSSVALPKTYAPVRFTIILACHVNRSLFADIPRCNGPGQVARTTSKEGGQLMSRAVLSFWGIRSPDCNQNLDWRAVPKDSKKLFRILRLLG